MDSNQANIIEYSCTVEQQMLIRTQFWELTSLFLKEHKHFTSTIIQDTRYKIQGTLFQARSPYFGMPNSFLNLLFSKF